MATNPSLSSEPSRIDRESGFFNRKREPLNEFPETKNVLLAYPRDTKS